MPEPEQERGDAQNPSYFDGCRNILEIRPLARTPYVDNRENGDHRHSNNLPGDHREWDDLAEVKAECNRQGCHRAAADQKEERPAVQESCQSAECVTNVDVKTTRFRNSNAQLAVGQSSKQ